MPDLIKSLSSILKNGGQLAAYRRINIVEDVISLAEVNWHAFNYRTTSRLQRNMNSEDEYGEDGEYLVTNPGNIDFRYIIRNAQLDKETLDFLIDYGSQNTFFEFIVRWGKGQSNKKLEAYLPVIQFKGDFDIDMKDRRFDITMQILNNVYTVQPANFTGISWVAGALADFSVTAGRKIAIAQTA